MPISLILGPQNSGKTSHFLELLRGPLLTEQIDSRLHSFAPSDFAPSGVVLVLPDRTSAAELRQRLLKGYNKAIATDTITDMRSFVKELAAPLSPIVTKHWMAAMILRIMAKERLTFFAAQHASSGLASEIAEAILRLKTNGIGPKKLSDKLANRGVRASRELDLLRIFKRYEEERNALDIIDDGDLQSLAIENLKKERIPRRFNTILIDEISSVGPELISLLTILSKTIPSLDIRVAFPTPDKNSPHHDLFADFLLRGQSNLSVIADVVAELKPLPLRNISTRVLSARSPIHEARSVCRMIAEALEKGTAPKSIVVCAHESEAFTDFFFYEAASCGLIPPHFAARGPMSAPFLHNLLSPDMLEKLPQEASINDFIVAMRNALTHTETPWHLTEKLKQNHKDAQHIARALSAAADFSNSLDRMLAHAKLLGLAKLRREEFVHTLANELGKKASHPSKLAPILPFRFIPFGSPISNDAELIIVPDMIEGSIPARSMDAPFFAEWHDDEEIRAIFPSHADTHAMQAYAFETICAKCTGELALIVPVINASGSETTRSAFVDRFAAPQEAALPLPVCIPKPSAAQDASWEKHAALMVKVETERTAGAVIKDAAHPEYIGMLRSNLARELVQKRFTEDEIAAKGIQDYAECPFRFFASRVLHINEPPEDTPEIRRIDRGTIVHEILKRFYSEHLEDFKNAQKSNACAKKIPQIVRKLAESVWDSHSKKLGNVADGLCERQLQAVTTMSLQVIEAELDEAQRISESLLPIACEWEFSCKTSNPLTLKIANEPDALVKGRIDRIDSDAVQKKFLILDYKTGKAKAVINEIANGAHLQIPLYIAAAENMFPNARPIGGLIIEVRAARAGGEKDTHGKKHGIVLREFNDVCFRIGRATGKVDANKMSDAINNAKKFAAEYINKMRTGAFPRKGTRCDNCNYGDSCRYKGVAAD